MYVFVFNLPSTIKVQVYIYTGLLKAVIIKNNYVCYVRYIATYTS